VHVTNTTHGPWPQPTGVPLDIRRGTASNHRIHLTRWAITALADEHRKQDHRSGLPGPRQPQPAGDANVRLL
jgi:hypothetical protein